MINIYKKLLAKVGILTVLSIIAASGCSSHTNDTRSFGKGEISLTVPAELSVRIIDGKIIQVPDYRDEIYTIRLTTGQHSLTFKYIDNWNNNMSRQSDILQSQPLLLTYNFDSSKSFMLSYTRPNDVDEARAMAKNPKVWLEENGKIVKQAIAK